MNEIVNKFLLAGDKIMPEKHLKQPKLSYSACEPFTKNQERIQNFQETGDSRYIYRNELNKACFQHDMGYGGFKDLNITIADKFLHNKVFNIAKNRKSDGYQRDLASMVYKCFDKKPAPLGSGFKAISNEKLAEELHKPTIRKLKKRQVYS